MPNEADTGRRWKFVVPKLQPAGWDNKPHSFAGQRQWMGQKEDLNYA
jgi:type I restriction enzyme R subunit